MPIATVGAPFSMRDTVSGEQVARSATCAMLKLRRKRASLICSPTTCIFCSNFRGNLVPIVLFAIISMYHIICKDNVFSLFYDRLSKKIAVVKKKLYGLSDLLSTCMAACIVTCMVILVAMVSDLDIGSLQNSEMYVDVTNCST